MDLQLIEKETTKTNQDKLFTVDCSRVGYLKTSIPLVAIKTTNTNQKQIIHSLSQLGW